MARFRVTRSGTFGQLHGVVCATHGKNNDPHYGLCGEHGTVAVLEQPSMDSEGLPVLGYQGQLRAVFEEDIYRV